MMNDWVVCNVHTGQRDIVDHDRVVRLSNMRKVSDREATKRDSGCEFETEHYVYRPMTDEDHQREHARRDREHRAFTSAWGTGRFTFRDAAIQGVPSVGRRVYQA